MQSGSEEAEKSSALEEGAQDEDTSFEDEETPFSMADSISSNEEYQPSFALAEELLRRKLALVGKIRKTNQKYLPS